MKKSLLSFALFMSVLSLFAQTDLPTYGYSYQAIIRNASGNIAANELLQLRFQILNSANQVQYEEIQGTTSDQFGRVAIVVGSGTATQGQFDTLDWAARKHYLGVAVKMDGAVDWAELGSEEVVQLPLAKGSSYWELNGDNIYRLDGNLGIGVMPEDNHSKFSIKKVSNEDEYIAWFAKDGVGSAYIGLKSGTDPSNANPRRTYFSFHDDHFSINALKPGVTQISMQMDATLERVFFQSPLVEVNGTTRTKILEITGGDVAEARHSTTGEPLLFGSVVVFDEIQQGKVRLTSKPYDKKVAGVISGAGKYFAGVCLLQEELSRGAMPIAQLGTVEVLVIGPVWVGDFLTTSNIPGYAMKAKNRRKSYGTVIGKAMTPLAKGEKGLVEMMVERH